jgi:hypothetical protein
MKVDLPVNYYTEKSVTVDPAALSGGKPSMTFYRSLILKTAFFIYCGTPVTALPGNCSGSAGRVCP